jgi:hypothetical protein
VIDDLLEEKAVVTRQAESYMGEVGELEEEVGACRSTISDLSGQLAASHQVGVICHVSLS